MGRHARGASLRVSVSTVVFGTLIVTVVAVGSLLRSQAQPTPTASPGVEGTAVVVSSLACGDGSGGTLVDVLSPAGLPAGTMVRASLNACGFQEGEQLVVQFPPGDPTQVSLAGSPDADAVDGGRLLPFGLVMAALLAVAAAIAVWMDARRSRRRRSDHPLVGRQESAGADSPAAPLASANARTVQGGRALDAGRHARPDLADDRPDRADDRPDRADGRPDRAAHSPRSHSPRPRQLAVQVTSGEGSAIPPTAGRVTRGLSSVDLAFPCAASLADSLHDELFTHRGVRT